MKEEDFREEDEVKVRCNEARSDEPVVTIFMKRSIFSLLHFSLLLNSF